MSKRVNLSLPSEVDDKIWSVNSMKYALGFFAEEVDWVYPAAYRFSSKALLMYSIYILRQRFMDT